MFLNKVEICGVNTSELPLLSDEEKENLFIQIEKGNMDAREQYVKGNLRLVLSVIQRFSNNHEHADDLFQVGWAWSSTPSTSNPSLVRASATS